MSNNCATSKTNTIPDKANAWGTHRKGTKDTRKIPKFHQYPFVDGLHKIHVALCPKIAHVHAKEVNKFETLEYLIFRIIL